MPFRCSLAVLILALCCALPLPLAADEGCYGERTGEEFAINLGEEFCLKNKKWNCKPLCFYFAGVTDDDTFSIGIARAQGGLNLYHPYSPGEKSEFTVSGNIFEIIELTPEVLRVKYLGE